MERCAPRRALGAGVEGGDKKVRLGIDFGTTRTVVAVCDRGNYPVLSFAGPRGESLDWYPTLAAFNGRKWVFGLHAKAVENDPKWTVLRSFKRMLSRPEVSPSSTMKVRGEEISLLDLLVSFVSALKHDILSGSNLPIATEPNEDIEVFVATPANAHNTQRLITLEAFRRAGFRVLAMLSEPSAAGLEYAHRYRNTINTKRENILVYDLGGGTFDVSLVRMAGKQHDVLETAGLAQLGGDDFDNVLFRLALKAKNITEGQLSHPSSAKLARECQIEKERLHPNSRRLTIEVGACLSPDERQALNIQADETVSLTTETFYQSCTPLIEDTLRLLNRTVDPKRRWTKEPPGALLDQAGVAGIYVVGGGSALPKVGRALKERFGRRVHRSAHPSASTAMGLAIAIDEQAAFEVNEQLGRNFGVFREAHGGRVVSFDPLLVANTSLPTHTEAPYRLQRTYRAAHNIGHFRFIECGWLEDTGVPAGDITPYADVLFPFDPELRRDSLDLSAVPVIRTTAPGPLIQEQYALNNAGIIEVTITDLDTGYRASHRLSRS